MPNTKQKGIVHLVLIIAFLVISMGVGVWLVKNPAIFKPKASEAGIVFYGPSVTQRDGRYYTNSLTVGIRLTSTLAADGRSPKSLDIDSSSEDLQIAAQCDFTIVSACIAWKRRSSEIDFNPDISSNSPDSTAKKPEITFRISEEPDSFATVASQLYTGDSVEWEYTFRDPNPGTKVVFVQFDDNAGLTKVESASVVYEPAFAATDSKIVPSPSSPPVTPSPSANIPAPSDRPKVAARSAVNHFYLESPGGGLHYYSINDSPAGWTNYGPAFYAYATQQPGTSPVNHFYLESPGGGLHYYSINDSPAGWTNYGPAFYAYANK